MTYFMRLITSLFLALTLSGCVQTTNDPAVGKADFLKFQEWIESEPLEDNSNLKDPETIEEMERFMDELFKKYVQQGKIYLFVIMRSENYVMMQSITLKII